MRTPDSRDSPPRNDLLIRGIPELDLTTSVRHFTSSNLAPLAMLQLALDLKIALAGVCIASCKVNLRLFGAGRLYAIIHTARNERTMPEATTDSALLCWRPVVAGDAVAVVGA